MKQLSLKQQIDVMRPTVRTGLARNVHRWLVVVAAVLLILSIVLWHPVPLMFAVFFGIVGIAERRAGPNLEAAIKAYDTGIPTSGEVSITSTRWDTDDHYHALVHEDGQLDWKYEFVPQGWQPTVGTHPASIWRARGNGSPVLTTVACGILVPRYSPTVEPTTTSAH